jgi:hypothetical protein
MKAYDNSNLYAAVVLAKRAIVGVMNSASFAEFS